MSKDVSGLLKIELICRDGFPGVGEGIVRNKNR